MEFQALERSKEVTITVVKLEHEYRINWAAVLDLDGGKSVEAHLELATGIFSGYSSPYGHLPLQKGNLRPFIAGTVHK
jgi:hypothetical protein